MLERKKELAERLLKRGITLFYLSDEGPVVFVAAKQMSGKAVKAMLSEEGYEIFGEAKRGLFATAHVKEEGYWCELQKISENESGECGPKSRSEMMCPVCQNEELHPGQRYCQICGKYLLDEATETKGLSRDGLSRETSG